MADAERSGGDVEDARAEETFEGDVGGAVDVEDGGVPLVGKVIAGVDGEGGGADGMPGQDLQRRVYVVHEQTLYVLAFMPTRLENKEAGDQMEALYATVMNSWAWSPCSAKE